MWTLHVGQIVEVATEFSSCVVPQSKQATEVIRGRCQMPPIRRSNDCAATTPPNSKTDFASTLDVGTTPKCLPHCRQSVLLAAAYSICLKPQCEHSTLTLAGDLATDLPGWLWA
jgi:hypothetical protein